MKLLIEMLAVAALIAGCAEQSVMRLSANTVRVNVSTAPIYGALEPERRVLTIAAQETLKNGYDRFLVIDGQSAYKPNVIGVIPGEASGAWGPYGGSGYMHATGPTANCHAPL